MVFLYFLFSEEYYRPISDDFVMYTMSIFNLSVVVLLLRQNKKLFCINLLAYVVYNAYFYYGLRYDSAGGSGLVWWSYILLVNGFHFLGTLIYLIRKFWKKNKF